MTHRYLQRSSQTTIMYPLRSHAGVIAFIIQYMIQLRSSTHDISKYNHCPTENESWLIRDSCRVFFKFTIHLYWALF